MARGKNKGIRRIFLAAGYSLSGLRAGFRSEAAFRQELALTTILVPVAVWLGQSRLEVALLIGVLLITLVTELLNSAIEAVVDLASPDDHPLAGRAKDLGSAAVMVSLVLTAVTWLIILLP